jgi:polysaccharide export outer membrane protein
LEEALRKRLAVYVEEPEVSVGLVEQRSQPVSVLGAVKNPGVQQLHGSKSLVEVLSLAGGVEADAGYSLRIARHIEQGALPLPGGQPDAAGTLNVAEVSLQEVMDGRFAAGNLAVKPHDIITVPRAKMVYVIGEVKKAGGFVLHERENMTVLQAVSLAEGLNRTAGGKNARILRPQGAGTDRKEIPVNLNSILDGKSSDVTLQPDDILFVPNSTSKSVALRTVEAAIQLGTGIAIWR